MGLCQRWLNTIVLLHRGEEGWNRGAGGQGEEQPPFLATPPFMEPGEEYGRVVFSSALSFCPFLCDLLPSGTGLGGGQRGAFKAPPSCGLRTGNQNSVRLAVIYLGRMGV